MPNLTPFWGMTAHFYDGLSTVVWKSQDFEEAYTKFLAEKSTLSYNTDGKHVKSYSFGRLN